MSVDILNGCVLIPHAPNWQTAPTAARRWQTEIVEAVTGAEERQAMILTPALSLNFLISTFGVNERLRLDDRLDAALKLGRAAVPNWGRSYSLANAAAAAATSIVLASVSLPAINDYLFFLTRDYTGFSWQTLQVTNVVGQTVSLNGGLNFLNPAGAFVWPILFGTPAAQDFSARTNQNGEIQLSISEPLGQGTLGTSSCGALAETPNPSGSFTVCEGKAVVTLQPKASCGTTRTFTWTPALGADTYNVKTATVAGGPYTTLASVAGNALLQYTVERTVIDNDDYYVVTSVTGGKESVKSNEIMVPRLSVEAEMRACQERYNQVIGSWITWPNRTLPAPGGPGNYPADGFYTADINAGGAATKRDLVQAIANALAEIGVTAWLSKYATTQAWTDLATIPRHSTTTLPPLTVTTGNYAASLRTIVSYLCQLTTIVVQAAGAQSGLRSAGGGSTSGCADAKQQCYDAYTAGAYTGSGTLFPELSEDTTSTGPANFSVNFISNRAKVQADLTTYTVGLSYLYLKLKPGGSHSASFQPSVGHYDSAPVPKNNRTFQLYSKMPLGGMIASPMFGEQNAPTWESNCPLYIIGGAFTGIAIGWIVEDALFQIFKSGDETLMHWTYYP